MGVQIISGTPRVSVEYFPAKGVVKERALMTAAHALRRFGLDFQTVTFGAGGTGVDGAFEWCTQLAQITDVPTVCHVTLSHFERRESLFAFLDSLWNAGIRRLVLLRGDAAEGRDGLCGYASVADALAAIKNQQCWDISVAAYPETHPLAQSADDDLYVLRAKQEAGADRAITQFFFNNADFYAFRDRALRAGVTLALVPGIMPITNFDRIASFAHACGAKVPVELQEAFAQCGNDTERHSDLARLYVQAQVTDLAANGVEAIHVYSMNRVDLAADALRAFKAAFVEQAAPLARAG